jgi:hypothetical protein
MCGCVNVCHHSYGFYKLSVKLPKYYLETLHVEHGNQSFLYLSVEETVSNKRIMLQVYSKEENELPQSIAVHPGGDGVLCSFSNSWK